MAQGGAEWVAERLSKRRGRKPSERNQRKLERENTRLEKELEKARLIIDVQGKRAAEPRGRDELVKAAEALATS